MGETSRRVRALVAVGVLAVVTAGAGTAGAAPAPIPRPVTGVASPSVVDPSCPSDPEFPNGSGPRRTLFGVVTGPDRASVLSMDLCYVFIGALGGQQIIGRFDLFTPRGRLTGVVTGTVGFSMLDEFRLVLWVERGTRRLVPVRGTLAFAGGADNEGGWTPLQHATLTPNLARTGP